MKLDSILIKSILLGFSFFCISCTNMAKKTSLPVSLFPDGTYTQSVQLVIHPGTTTAKQIPFTSLSRIKGDKFKIMGLTPFGTKAFEAQGDLKNEDSIQLQFHMETPKELSRDFVKKTLFQMHSFKSLKRKQLNASSQGDWVKKDNIRLDIYSYTPQGIPKEFKVTATNWMAFVATSRYQMNLPE